MSWWTWLHDRLEREIKGQAWPLETIILICLIWWAISEWSGLLLVKSEIRVGTK